MTKIRDPQTHQLLVLLKLDALRLFERIKYRAPEYLNIFSTRRIREHFDAIFKNKYDSIELADLKRCSEDVIIGLDQFYTKVDELRWYLGHTQEMPGTISDKVYARIHELEQLFETLTLYIDAELGIRPSVELGSDELMEAPEYAEYSEDSESQDDEAEPEEDLS